jgi:hypothetical protein
MGSSISKFMAAPVASSVVNPVLANYNTTPATQAGVGAYGTVPGATATPPSTYEQISGITPQLSSLTNQNANLIGQQMKGVLPTDVIKKIQDMAASWGVSSGMPGSGLSQNLSLRDLGLTSLQEQQTGQTNYLNTLSGLGQQQLDPGLLTSLSQSNATLAAAPNPQAAADQQMMDYLMFLNAAQPSQGTLIPNPAAPTSWTAGIQSAFTPPGGTFPSWAGGGLNQVR